jgi:hypothetical protein
MPKAINSKGTIVAIGSIDDPSIPVDPKEDTFVGLCNIIGVEYSGETTDEIDVTTLGSETREFIPGFTDSGSITLNGNYLPGDEGQKLLQALKASKDVGNFQIMIPDNGLGGGGSKIYQHFKASVTGITPALAVGAAVTFSATLRISGVIEEEIVPNPVPGA